MRQVFAFGLLAAGMTGCGSDDGGGGTTQQPKPDASIIDGSNDVPSDGDAGFADAGDAESGTPFTGPTKLSETGLFTDILTRTLAPGVRPFDVRYTLWSDGAQKKRFLWLPPGEKIDTSFMDVWNFPIGTKAWKEFYKDGKLIETRLLWKQAEGPDGDGWLKIAYLWNEEGSDAIAVPNGMQNASGTTHDVPSIDMCEQCHNGAGDVLIGVAAIQLSKENGGGYLSTLIADGVLSNPPAGEFKVPGDGTVEDAIGYLHGNCGQCHNNESFVGAARPLRLKLTVGAAQPADTPLYQTAIGGQMNHVIEGTIVGVVPGKPNESQLFVRMGKRDLEQMPPIATEQTDPTGLATIQAWILALPP